MPYSHTVSRRQVLAAAGGSALTLAMPPFTTTQAAPTTAPPGRRPNVLLVMSDEHHPAYTSVTGHSVVQTPNMARLAQAGTVFENTYCPSPLCSPCRSSFATGRRVHQIQWYNNCNAIERGDTTYGKLLQDAGVHSVFIGKSDLHKPLAKTGFSEILVPGDRKPPGDRTLSRRPLARRENAARRANGFGPHDDPFRGDDLKTEAALKWLKETAPALDRPWVMSVNLSKPHFPHYVTKDLWDQYAGSDNLPKYGRDEPSANHPRARDLRSHFDTDAFTDEQTRGLRRGYLGCITYVDRQLGRLMDAVAAAGQLENTVIIYTSDHGDMIGKFGMWWKSSLYDDSVRVPMIVAGPGYGAGRRIKTPVDLLDLQASLFATTGVARPGDWIGTPLQQIPEEDDGRVVFSEYHGHGTQASSYVIRRGDWKLIYHVDAPHQLFDLSQDPDELRNLADEKSAVRKELEAELRKICDPEAENARAEAMIQKQLATMAADKAATGE